jgi:hypothetical protein
MTPFLFSFSFFSAADRAAQKIEDRRKRLMTPFLFSSSFSTSNPTSPGLAIRHGLWNDPSRHRSTPINSNLATSMPTTHAWPR